VVDVKVKAATAIAAIAAELEKAHREGLRRPMPATQETERY
jgi:hypothetical protein